LPRLEAPDCGVIARADRALRDRINAAAEQLVRRRAEVKIAIGSTLLD
jgi:hypothetical protein